MPRVGVNLTDSAYHEVESLASEKGKPITQVLRDALAFEKWVQEERKNGGRILVERDGDVREIIPR